MNRLKVFLVFLFVGVISLSSNLVANNPKGVTVEIDYGGLKPEKKIETNWREGLSALEALQFVAHVSTHPVGEYVFVSGIDKIAGTPNKDVWYYKINGESAKKIAINQELKKGDVVTWIFKQDVCSRKKQEN